MHHRPKVVHYQTLPPGLGNALSAEVRALRKRVGNRLFATTVGLRALSAGGVPLPGGSSASLPPGCGTVPGAGKARGTMREFDHALRVDLLVAAVGGMRSRTELPPTRAVGILITRAGVLEVTEDDFGWLRAWQVASDIGSCTRGPVWAITRNGWVDVAENCAVPLPRHWLRRTPQGHGQTS